MSLSIDGLFKAGLFSETLFADGLFREGEVSISATWSVKAIQTTEWTHHPCELDNWSEVAKTNTTWS